jgi:MFS family permease
MKSWDLSRDSVFRLGTVALLIFAQSIPEKFFGNALPLVYRSLGMELSDFWVFSIPLIPRWLKWLVAPYLDRKPLMSIGLRRSWILILTPLSALTYTALALNNPTLENVYLIVFILFWAEALTALQDIPVDGYCVESLGPKENRLSGTVINLANVLSFALVSAVLMVLYARAGWSVTIFVMAALFLVCTLPALLRPEPIPQSRREEIFRHAGRPSILRAFTRENAVPLFSLVAAAGLYTSFTGLSHTMLVDKGLSIAEIGIAAGVGVSAGIIIGSFVSGWMLLRFALKRVCLMACGFLILAHLLEIGMAVSATVPMVAFMLVTVCVEVAVAPHYILMSTARFRWTTKRQAGTDFAVQSSVRALAMTLGSAIAGPVADLIGWPLYYVSSIALGLAATYFMFLISDQMEATMMRELQVDELDEGKARIAAPARPSSQD